MASFVESSAIRELWRSTVYIGPDCQRNLQPGYPRATVPILLQCLRVSIG